LDRFAKTEFYFSIAQIVLILSSFAVAAYKILKTQSYDQVEREHKIIWFLGVSGNLLSIP